MREIPFNRPFTTGRELDYVREAIENGHLSGSGPFTELCNRWLEQRVGSELALLTHSCTAALEMAAMLLDLGPGDEVVMPSFTFVSTANAVASAVQHRSSSTFAKTPSTSTKARFRLRSRRGRAQSSQSITQASAAR